MMDNVLFQQEVKITLTKSSTSNHWPKIRAKLETMYSCVKWTQFFTNKDHSILKKDNDFFFQCYGIIMYWPFNYFYHLYFILITLEYKEKTLVFNNYPTHCVRVNIFFLNKIIICLKARVNLDLQAGLISNW